MREALESAAADNGARAELESVIAYPGYQYDEQAPVVQAAKKAIEAIGLSTCTFQSGGGSDANIFNGFGIPTVDLLSAMAHIHTTKEQIKADNLSKTAELVLEIIRQTAAN